MEQLIGSKSGKKYVKAVYCHPDYVATMQICFCGLLTQSCLTLQPQELQHVRLPCPSPSPRVCSSSCLQGALRRKRGSGTSLSKAEGSRGEVSLLSANPAPRLARDNQTRQGFRLSSSALLPQTLGLYRQARGFRKGRPIVAPVTLKVKL